ncbi:MAG: 2-C-methyl-D-erythritol 4-phosphate cytidylyltransferase [Butyrivibrio sp.]|nr:2-C-methyl-D-erythritol 4-phosphate cytidylyltransferase [Acetatifactor muris]MCM1559070.1 2-C-methyl-D-erythritol 4-phosphate cytidylyltransferase [Butyrivibrio sp.]
MKKRCTAIVLAAGGGRRMNSTVAKQFMLLGDKPLLWYSLRAVEQSEIIDDCILVAGKEAIPYVKREIVEKYGFGKVDTIVPGGRERWESVANAVAALGSSDRPAPNREGYVFIHDGARPFLTEEILGRTYEAVQKYHACVAAMPSKDTVKLADEEGLAVSTPDRRFVWSVQTPQVFDTELIVKAYGALWEKAEREGVEAITVTDDAGVAELFADCPVKLTEGSYENIKITTPEDMKIAEMFLKKSVDRQFSFC